MKYPYVLVVTIGIAALAACSKPPGAPSPANTVLRIEALPPADSQKVNQVRKMKDWKNPYLIVRVDGVALLDVSNNEQKLLTTEQLPGALAELPSSAWPYGRVVAVAENPAGSDADKAQLRKNRALVAGTLQDLQVLINWVPSA
jgi:hypothetical protein